MTHPFTVLKSCGPKLVPFFKTCTIFFVLYGEKATHGSILFCLFKCLPVISLVIFVLLHGMNLSSYYTYSRRIIAGLTFSLFGDAFLVWSHTSMNFELGLGMFAIAQLLYAVAFGWKPLSVHTGVVLSLLAAIVYWFLTTEVSGILTYLIGMYIALIFTMAWRAIARSQIFSQPYEKIPWTKLSGGLGAILFLMSDFTIAVDKFKYSVPFAHTIIMTTYFAAQLCIALSVVDSQVDVVIEETRKENGNIANGDKKALTGYGKALKVQ